MLKGCDDEGSGKKSHQNCCESIKIVETDWSGNTRAEPVMFRTKTKKITYITQFYKRKD